MGSGAGFYRFLALSFSEAERCQVELHCPSTPALGPVKRAVCNNPSRLGIQKQAPTFEED